MKLNQIFLLLMLLCFSVTEAQERQVIYREGFGEFDLYQPYIDIEDYKGWEAALCHYSGTGRVGSYNSHICALPGSSKGRYVYFSSSTAYDMTIQGIDISGYHDLELSYNVKKSLSGSGKMTITVSVDGGKPTNNTPAMVATKEWYSASPVTITEGSTLTLTFTNKETDVTVYLDDLEITGVPDAPDAPQFDIEGGLYTAPLTLTLSANPGSSIYYTLDGTTPTENSSLYQEPLLLDHTTMVSAVSILGDKSSDVTSAYFEIIPVPTVESLYAFKRASEQVRLDLVQAEVVDVAHDGICVQTSEGGLLLPADGLTVQKGDALNGFLIGKPVSQNGMIGVEEGVFRGISVAPGAAAMKPFPVLLKDLTSDSQSYSACLVQLTEMAYLPDKGVLVCADDLEGETLRVRTGEWGTEESWQWPAKFTLTGVLKGDEDGMYLWVAEAEQIVSSDQPEILPAAGTALVVTETDGSYYAACNQLKNGALPCVRTAILDGRAVALKEDISKLSWNVDTDHGHLRTPDGLYLKASSSSTALQLVKSSDALCKWVKDETGGYWMSKQTSPVRVLMRIEDNNEIKNYSREFIGNYSAIPAVDVPLYEGYLRELTPGRWGTLCVPYSVNAGDLSGALFFEIKGQIKDDMGITQSVVLSDPVAQLEAGVPYIIYAESSYMALLYSGDAVSVPLCRNGLYGTFEGVNPEKNPKDEALVGKYVFSGNTLRKCAAGSSVGQNKAFVDLASVPVLHELPEGALRIQLYKEPTDMYLPENISDQDLPVFSLQGIYLGEWGKCMDLLPKGIYIIKGKKIILK